MKNIILLLVLILNINFYTQTMFEGDAIEQLKKGQTELSVDEKLYHAEAAAQDLLQSLSECEQTFSYEDLKNLIFLWSRILASRYRNQYQAEFFISPIRCCFQLRHGISFLNENIKDDCFKIHSFTELFAAEYQLFVKNLLNAEEGDVICRLFEEFFAAWKVDKNFHHAFASIITEESMSSEQYSFLTKFSIECAYIITKTIPPTAKIKKGALQAIIFISALVTRNLFQKYTFLPIEQSQKVIDLTQRIKERQRISANLLEVLGDDGMCYMLEEIKNFFERKYAVPMPRLWSEDEDFVAHRVFELASSMDIQDEFDLDKELDSTSFPTRRGELLHLNVTTIYALRCFIAEMKVLVMLFSKCDLIEGVACENIEKIITQSIITTFQQNPMYFNLDDEITLVLADALGNKDPFHFSKKLITTALLG